MVNVRWRRRLGWEVTDSVNTFSVNTFVDNVVGDQTGFNCIVQSEVIMYTGFKCRVNVLGDETESKCRV